MKQIFCLISLLLIGNSLAAQQQSYRWLDQYDPGQVLLSRIPVPEGYVRVSVADNSFAEWLRVLPLKAAGSPVRLFDGRQKPNQRAHVAVLEIDVGDRDLQQCADAVMRLRAEYLLACGEYQAISFNFTSGDAAIYAQWKRGFRPRVSGNQVDWRKTARPDDSYAGFRNYLTTVFTYAGTWSLSRELEPVQHPDSLRPGDVFIQGGFPGHAVLVMDVARHRESGKKVFLLAQSYMPAQDIHLLKNPESPISPWYEIPGGVLSTPEWNFPEGSLMRFPGN